MTATVSLARRAALAGAICVAVLGASLVLHAWPLWTGRPILLRVVPIDPRDPFRGEYVWLAFREQQLIIGDTASMPPNTQAIKVRPIGTWWKSGMTSADTWRFRDRALFVQLEPEAAGNLQVWHAVSIADRPVDGATNLRGLVRFWYPGLNNVTLDYGLDAFYMPEGRAAGLQGVLRGTQPVYAEVMVTGSGHARLRRLLNADGSVIAPR